MDIKALFNKILIKIWAIFKEVPRSVKKLFQEKCKVRGSKFNKFLQKDIQGTCIKEIIQMDIRLVKRFLMKFLQVENTEEYLKMSLQEVTSADIKGVLSLKKLVLGMKEEKEFLKKFLQVVFKEV